MDGKEFRRRRNAIRAAQKDIASRAGSTDTTLRKFETGRVGISAKQREALWAALEAAERDHANPPATPAPATEDDLRAVLDELRAFRRLYEDDRAQTGRLADTIEALAARLGPRP